MAEDIPKLTKTATVVSFSADLLIDENGEQQQFEEARAKWLERRQRAPSTSSAAIGELLATLERWQPQRVRLTDDELRDLRLAATSGDIATPRAGAFGVPTLWLDALLRRDDQRQTPPMPLLRDADADADAADATSYAYVNERLFRALLRQCGSTGVWCDGGQRERALRVLLKGGATSSRSALLLVPTTACAGDVLLRACVSLSESVVDRHLELPDGTPLGASESMARVFVGADDLVTDVVLAPGGLDKRRKLLDHDSDDDKNNSNAAAAADDDADADDDNALDADDASTRRLLARCARSVTALAAAASAAEQALIRVASECGSARADVAEARRALGVK